MHHGFNFSLARRSVHIGLCAWLWLACWLLSSAGAAAQEGGETLKLGASMVIDFAGQVERDPSTRGNTVSSGARVTPGFRLHADYDVHRHVSVGGMLRFGFWRSDRQDDSRNLLVDLAARVNGHYDFKDFRFYGVFMIGPTFDRLRPTNTGGLDNPGVGAVIALAPGFEWWFSRRFAAFTEILGWTGHYFSHDYENVPGHVTFRMNQVLWQIGVLTGL